MELRRQHLIDPAICIRCNTCEETCPIGAITHDDRNYVVRFDVCNGCGHCVPPCPTGAIDSWILVKQPWSIEDQFGWDDLPASEEGEAEAAGPADSAEPAEVAAIIETATAATGGRVPPPFSAAHPYVHIYTRERPAVAKVAGNYRITDPETESDIHHIVLDFGQQAFPVLEGQSIGIVPPGSDAKGRAHTVRLYSVASPRDGERPNHNNVSLTVKRVVARGADGTAQPGLASNYLCDARKGDEVLVTGPFGDSFLMPNHPEANIIMICTGTGSAPFRAFTERRRRRAPDAPGRLMLFFGARSPGELPYFGPLMKLPASLIDVNLAFSRLADQPKVYVQDKIRERGGDVASLLGSGDTFVYVCGLKGMEQGCEEALADVCRRHGLDWTALRAAMRREGRYHVETY
ncbi:benzoyl-CoA 2,3-epoxidase subunit BoxA [Azospirillum sp. ST 5-10]|uniref:benzoyl-CoA 2,3-epoxidase subunit BoxA n=1 Tax=unclassified Azospirillum TaxID=2630922 RepID=UPI003F49FA22